MNGHGRSIDLNADVGEIPAALKDGSEDRLLQMVSSANVACGGHAGDVASMETVLRLCVTHGVRIGAHPAFPDRANFGRKMIEIGENQLKESIVEQLRLLKSVAGRLGAVVQHVKPHGALYNAACRDSKFAALIADAVSQVDRHLVLVGFAGSEMLRVWKSEGFATSGEAFADRRYEPDGTLRSRTLPGALIINPTEAAEQALSIVQNGTIMASNGSLLSVEAQTICIHGDNPNALAIATQVLATLQHGGFSVAPA